MRRHAGVASGNLRTEARSGRALRAGIQQIRPQHCREPVRGERVQVIVAQAAFNRHSAAGCHSPMASRARRRTGPPRPTPWRSPSQADAHEPQVPSGVVLGREKPARFRPAHDADQGNTASQHAMRRRILLPFRHEAAVQNDRRPVGNLRGCKHPIAEPGNVGTEGRANGVDQRLVARLEGDEEHNAAEFILAGIEGRPLLRRRQRDRIGRERRSACRSALPSGLALNCRCQAVGVTKAASTSTPGGTNRPTDVASDRRSAHGASPPARRPSATL